MIFLHFCIWQEQERLTNSKIRHSGSFYHFPGFDSLEKVNEASSSKRGIYNLGKYYVLKSYRRSKGSFKENVLLWGGMRRKICRCVTKCHIVGKLGLTKALLVIFDKVEIHLETRLKNSSNINIKWILHLAFLQHLKIRISESNKLVKF